MFVMLCRQTVERERLFDVLFDPDHQLRVAAFPLRDPRRQIVARFSEVAPFVDPTQLAQAVIVALARKMVQTVPQKVHVAALPGRLRQHLRDRRSKACRSSVTTSSTPVRPRVRRPSRNSFQLLMLSRLASSTPRTQRRPSQLMPIATNTARLWIVPFSRTRS